MEFITFYKDPKKRLLQKIEIGLLILVTPFALLWGVQSFRTWLAFSKAEALFLEGDVHLHSGRSAQALQSFEQSVAIFPDYYGAWEGLGATHHLLNQHDKELKAYKRAIAAVPYRGELYRELGTAYHENGDHKAELEQLSIASAMLGEDEIFTFRLLDRAKKEADGTYPLKPAKVNAAAKATATPALNLTPTLGSTPALDPRDQFEHGHTH